MLPVDVYYMRMTLKVRAFVLSDRMARRRVRPSDGPPPSLLPSVRLPLPSRAAPRPTRAQTPFATSSLVFLALRVRRREAANFSLARDVALVPPRTERIPAAAAKFRVSSKIGQLNNFHAKVAQQTNARVRRRIVINQAAERDSNS